MVYDYIDTVWDIDDYLTNIAPNNLLDLNTKFANLLKNNYSTGISPDDYMTLLKNTYVSHDNFLIDRVTSVPNDTSPYYTNPFKIIDKPYVKNYILSKNYWGNEVAVYALCMKLKLNWTIFIIKIY